MTLGDIHFVLAFLVALCVLVFSWNALGRRVVNVVLGVQFLAGIGVVADHAMHRETLPPGTALHVAGAFVALALYGLASRIGRRPGGATAALGLSIAGLLVIAATIYAGMRMFFAGH